MSNQSRTQAIAHVSARLNRCTAFECNAQHTTERVSRPTVAPTLRLPLWHSLPNMLRYFRPETTNLGSWEQPRD